MIKPLSIMDTAVFLELQDAGEFVSWNWSNEGNYEIEQSYENDSPRGYGLRAYKRELVARGYTNPMMQDSGVFGKATQTIVTKFQKGHPPLIVDGIIGPDTAAAICDTRVTAFERAVGGAPQIPERLLKRQGRLESNFYTACRNNTNDVGPYQMHDPLDLHFADGKPVCPNGDLEFAFRIGTSVHYAAEHMRASYQIMLRAARLLTSTTELWYGAVFAWNAPSWAVDWIGDGLPEEGGGDLGEWFANYTKCTTRYEWAWKYVNLVRKQPA